MRRRDRVMVAALVVVCFGLVFYRVHRMRGSEDGAVPVRHHELILDIRILGHGDDVSVRSYLPLENRRQYVRDELVSSGAFEFSVERENGNRLGVWTRAEVDGPQSLVYSSVIRTRSERYELSDRLPVPRHHPTEVARWLQPTETIQSDAREIRELLDRLVPADRRDNATAIVRAAFDHAHGVIAPASYKGMVDALTCLRLGEASCGGKTRLFLALVRAAGLPARPVGGVILKNATWSAGHVWSEVYLGGHWVPFCPLNGYFAEVPDRYLATYVGDLPQFTHTRDVNFRYAYTARRILAPSDWAAFGSVDLFDAPNLWAAFELVRIPVNLLKIILMIPFGALVVVICRNLVGVETFGTFMPALIAVAFRDTGLAWGIGLFVLILLIGSVVRFGLGKFQLLHTPRLSVILTVTVMTVLGVALLGFVAGLVLPTRVSLFPLAILTLTVERFSVLLEEDGPRRAAEVSAGTLAVASLAYFVMVLEPLQVAVLTFPELLLLVMAAFFVTGRWSGMRLSELVRFRDILRPETPA